jgi:hypothetical protein
MNAVRFAISLLILAYIAIGEALDNRRNEEAAE